MSLPNLNFRCLSHLDFGHFLGNAPVRITHSTAFPRGHPPGAVIASRDGVLFHEVSWIFHDKT